MNELPKVVDSGLFDFWMPQPRGLNASPHALVSSVPIKANQFICFNVIETLALHFLEFLASAESFIVD